MNEWIKKNNAKVIYGLAVLVVILLIWVFSARSTSSREIARLGNANSALATESAAKDKEIGEAKDKIDELTRDFDASVAEVVRFTDEIAKLTADNSELSGNVTALDASLSDTKVELDRFEFVALLREKSLEDLRNEVAVLRRVEVESKEEAEKLTAEIARLTLANGELSDEVNSLDASLSEAKVELDRSEFVALLREKNLEDLRNEVEVLRRVEVETQNEIVSLSNAKLALEADSAAKSGTIAAEREKLGELTRDYEASLANAKIEIDRLDFVGLLREKNIEDLMNEVEVLRRVEVEAQNEIVRLSNAKLALEADSAAKSGTIAAEREKLSELTRDYDASLAEATIEIDRLEFVALLREKNIEDLTNEVTVLRQVEAESVEIIVELLEVIEAADAKISQLEETIKDLGGN